MEEKKIIYYSSIFVNEWYHTHFMLLAINLQTALYLKTNYSTLNISE